MPVESMPARVARKFRRLLLLGGLAALALPGVAKAATVQYSLADLLPGGQQGNGITLGYKRYSGFTFSSTGSTPLTPRDVNVRVTSTDTNPAIAGDDTYSLQFTFGLDAFPGERTDLVLCYRVDVLDPNMVINQVGLRFNGSVPSQGPGNAAASVIETVQTTDGSDVAPGAPIDDTMVLDVFNDGPGRLSDDNSDFVTVNPARSLLFCKDILVSSRPDGGYAAISVVDNIVVQIPEPAMIGFAGFVGLGLLARRRR